MLRSHHRHDLQDDGLSVLELLDRDLGSPVTKRRKLFLLSALSRYSISETAVNHGKRTLAKAMRNLQKGPQYDRSAHMRADMDNFFS